MTNKLLRNDATKICVAYEGMEKFFLPKNYSDGVIRASKFVNGTKTEAYKEFGFSPKKKHC